MKLYNFNYLWKWIEQWFDENLNPKFEITIGDLQFLPFGVLTYNMTDENGDYIEDENDWFKQRTSYMENMLNVINNDKQQLKKIYNKYDNR